VNDKMDKSLLVFAFVLTLTVASAATAQSCVAPRRCATASDEGTWYFPGGPAGLAVSEGIVWVAYGPGSGAPGYVASIDARTGEIVTRIEIGRDPVGLAIAHGSVWVVNRDDGTVSRIDPATHAVVATIPVGTEPVNVAASDDAVWVTNSHSGSVSRIDPETNRTAATVEIGAPCRAGVESRPSAHCSMPIGITVRESTVWVTDYQDDKVVRIDATSNEIIGEPIAVGEGPEVIVVNGDAAWVAISIGNARWGNCRRTDCGRGVSRIDLETNQVVATIPIRGKPVGLAMDADAIWVSLFDLGDIVKIDSNTNSIVGRPLRVAPQPSLMTVGEQAIWVSSGPIELLSKIPLDVSHH
jgi:YVTN family beta-propeller protein